MLFEVQCLNLQGWKSYDWLPYMDGRNTTAREMRLSKSPHLHHDIHQVQPFVLNAAFHPAAELVFGTRQMRVGRGVPTTRLNHVMTTETVD